MLWTVCDPGMLASQVQCQCCLCQMLPCMPLLSFQIALPPHTEDDRLESGRQQQNQELQSKPKSMSSVTDLQKKRLRKLSCLHGRS